MTERRGGTARHRGWIQTGKRQRPNRKLRLEHLESRLPLHASVLISELMIAPAVPNELERTQLPDAVATDFQFVELLNSDASTSVSVGDMQLEGDISARLSDEQMSPGESVVVVANEEAFRVRYGDAIRIVGEFEGTLHQLETQVSLIDFDSHALVEIRWTLDELWPSRALGVGPSLELVRPTSTLASQMSKPQHWQASPQPLGSPGQTRQLPRGVEINELLAGTDATSGLMDQVELWNRTDAPINLDGWYLSDEATNPLKFAIPAGTVIPEQGYVVLDSRDFNPTPSAPALHHFALDRHRGGALFLTAENPDDGQWTFEDGVTYGAHRQSWGQYPHERSRGWGPLSSSTFGSPNAGGFVGSVVITEFNYHPAPPSPAALSHAPMLAADDLEFVEVFNNDALAFDLSGWSLGGDIDFDFPPGSLLSAGQSLIVVPFETELQPSNDYLSAFATHYGIDRSQLLVLGGYTGSLRDDFGILQLLRPGRPAADLGGMTPDELYEQVLYDDVHPWPAEPDGGGNTLTRTSVDRASPAAEVWQSQAPTPGSTPFVPPVQHQLPDLAFWSDPLLGINHLERVEVHPSTGRKLMRFSTGFANVGSGPLVIVGKSDADANGPVVQVVSNVDGSTTEFDAGRFSFHPDHEHVHFADYAFYRLREVTDDDGVGQIIAGGDKVSFCLMDSHPFDRSLENSPPLPQYTVCESRTQGISVGWADLYSANVPDQWIDIEDVPPGEYWFETVIDPFNALLETDESNNVFRTKVAIHVSEYAPDHLDELGISDYRILEDEQTIERLSIHKPGDIDAFRWTASRDGQLSVKLAFDHDLGDVDLYVWHTDQQAKVVVRMSVTDRNQEQLTLDVVRGKTYFIVAKDLSGSTNPNYSLALSGPESQPDVYEPNDTVLAVADLGSGEVVISDLTLDNLADQDYFAWTADQSTRVRVDVSRNEATSDLSLVIHDFGNHVVYSAMAAQQSFEFDAIEGTTYVLVVASPQNEIVTSYALGFTYVDTPINPEPTAKVVAAYAFKAGESKTRVDLIGDQPTIPWLDLAQIQLVFSTDVAVTQEDLRVTGEVIAEYAILDFDYDDENFLGTWTVRSPVAVDTIRVRTRPSLTDRDGNPLEPLVAGWQAHPGDFRQDGDLNEDDIYALAAGLRMGSQFFDLNGDERLNRDDISELVTSLMGSVIGDSNLDGAFDTRDIVFVFQSGEFEDALSENSTWQTGDWNGDGEFDSSDFVFALQEGVYEQLDSVIE